MTRPRAPDAPETSTALMCDEDLGARFVDLRGFYFSLRRAPCSATWIDVSSGASAAARSKAFTAFA